MEDEDAAAVLKVIRSEFEEETQSGEEVAE